MKIIVTHTSPDMDAITSVWLIKKFLPGWEDAEVRFVPAGERLEKNALRSLRQFGDSPNSDVSQSSSLARAKLSKIGSKSPLFERSPHAKAPRASDVVEKIGGDEVIHVDTGLGPLDHHQTADDNVCGASLTWEYVKYQISNIKYQKVNKEKQRDREEAVSRIVKVVVDNDHFKEVFWPNPTADYHEFSVGAVLDGLKLAKPNQDEYYVDFISECLDAILHEFENRIWAEKEIATNGHKFETRFGKGIGFETINDSVIKLAQKMGYVIVVRKDPRKGYVRIKAMPSVLGHAGKPVSRRAHPASLARGDSGQARMTNADINLTLAYERLKKMDPGATWFLHIGKKMLLNGSVKNPKMRPTRLGLGEIIKVLEKI